MVRVLVGGVRRDARAALVAVVVAVVASLTFVPLPGASAQPQLLLPDLVSDPPLPDGPPEVVEIGGEQRLVLRFTGYVTNVGDGPLDVTGNPQLANPSDPLSNEVYQRVRTTDGNWVNVTKPLVRYETADGHNHFHLMEITRYTLWNASKTAQVAPGQKVGFCLYDIERLGDRHPNPGPLTYSGSVVRWCESGNPNASYLRMGITEGWRDIYGASLTLQWVDVSNVAPGEYFLASESDPYGRIVESNEANNGLAFAVQKSVVPGYVANPVGPVSVVAGAPQEVTLSTTAYGAPSGARQFVVTKGPAHGSINVAVGQPFATNRFTYTPAPGFTGTDTIEYQVRQAGSPYPHEPQRASVTLVVGNTTDPSVTISGAPALLVTETSAQLTAVTANLTGGVTWSVNGVTGGNAAVGTISPTGLYQAPATVPLGGVVTIRATSQTQPNVFGEVSISVVPPNNQAPNITDPGNKQTVVGTPVNLEISAYDPEGAPITFTAMGLPPGLTIGLTNGQILGTPSAVGVYSVTVLVSDGVTTSSISFTWTVQAPPDTGQNVAVGRPASQVATDGPNVASRAVDGNTNGNLGAGSVTSTLQMAQPWWQVDLQADHAIDRIVLWNRTDCCSTRLSNFYVFVSSQPFGDRTLAQVLADPAVSHVFHEGPAPPGSLTVPFPTTGRHVRIQLSGTNRLHLAEVQVMVGGTAAPNRPPTVTSPGNQLTPVGGSVDLTLVGSDPDGDPLLWSATGLPPGLVINPTTGRITGTAGSAGDYAVTVQVHDGRVGAWVDFAWQVVPQPTPGEPVNLALGRPASQSSTGGPYHAARANDGVTNGDFWSGSVSHTSQDVQPWWQVDLGATRQLDRVTLWNRTDCCATRLADFWVLVSTQPFTPGASLDTLRNQAGVVAVAHAGAAPAGPVTVALPTGTQGRHVRVMLSGTDYLHLAEVQVLGWS